jgi:hypothetical protein
MIHHGAHTSGERRLAPERPEPMRTSKRTSTAAQSALDGVIDELAELLAPAEDLALQRAPRSAALTVLVVGAPLGGATLALQWLAASGSFGYPTNLLARFAHAPLVGARIQRLLFDPRRARGGDLADLRPASVAFESSLEGSSGALAPNEFSAFWERYIPGHEAEPLGGRAATLDFAGLGRTLTALACLGERPFALVAERVQYDLAHCAHALPGAFFLHVIADEVDNACALLDARKKLHGSHERWHGARPAEYWELVALPPVEQVAGQVLHTHRHLREARAALPSERSLEVDVAELRTAPRSTHARLMERLAAFAAQAGLEWDAARLCEYRGPEAIPGPPAAPRRAAEQAQRAAVAAACRALEPRSV